MKKYSLLVFDWDGTLVDSERLAVTALRRAAADFAYSVPTEQEVRDCFGLELRMTIKRLLPQAVVEPLVERFYHYFDEEQLAGALFENVLESLTKLRERNFILAVATNRSTAALVQALQLTQLSHLFTRAYAADQFIAKPDPTMMLALLETLAIPPAEVLMIGDTIFDMQFAHNARVDALAVCYGHNTKEELAAYRPVGFINSMLELEQFLGE